MSSLRWTPEQLENYRKRREPRLRIDEPIALVAQPQRVSKLERRFSQQLADNPDLPPHQRNYFFLPDRDLELDFAWPAARLAVEVQGMAHRIKAKFKRDIEKRALALLAGWSVLEVGGDEVRSGKALEWLRALLEMKKPGQRPRCSEVSNQRLVNHT